MENEKLFTGYQRKSINELQPGDIILHPIYRSDGLMLVNKYKRLSTNLINRIAKQIPDNMNVLVVSYEKELHSFIENKIYRSSEFINEIKEIIMKYKIYMSIPFSINSFVGNTIPYSDEENIITKDNTNDDIRKFNCLKIFYKIPFYRIFEKKLESVEVQKRAINIKKKLNDVISNDKDFYELFIKLTSYHDILFLHSINATIISLMIGLTLELSDEDLIDLAVASIFADIGFTEIPQDEFRNYLKNRNNEKETLKKHIKIFMNMSARFQSLRKGAIIYGILDRHEAYNGGGFPTGKRGKNISLFGRILSISQAYDEMVGGYLYNDGLTPLEAMRILWENKENQYDPDIIKIFMYRTRFYKIGESYALNRKVRGKISGFTDFIDSPHLPIIETEDGEKINLFDKKI